MSTVLVKEQSLEKQMEKQMGCMVGFLQIFHRHHILSGKRHYSAKRVPLSSPVTDTTSESEKSAPPSPAISERPKPSPAEAVADFPPKSPLRLPFLELKEGTMSPWKFGKETPRLSLDSRATTDAKGGLHPKEICTGASTANRCYSIASDATDESQQHRSPSVIARLMGLEPLPDSSISEPETKPELRRSASESRVSRDLFQSRIAADKPTPSQSAIFNNVQKDNAPMDAHYADPRNYISKNSHKAEPPQGLNRGSFNSSSSWKAPQHHRRGFFDWGDFFPEPKPAVSMYDEIENKLKIGGVDEPAKDLETLKQILEALQLKGLLHSRKLSKQIQVRHRNIVYDESPIVVMKSSRLSNSSPISRRRGNDSSPSSDRYQTRGVHRNHSLAGENSSSVSPLRERNVRSPNRSCRSPSPTTTTRNESNAIGRRSNSQVKPKPFNVETQRRKNESIENQRVSPVLSPKPNSRRTRPDTTASKKSTAQIHQKEKITNVDAAEDESPSISGSSSSITTSTDTERYKTEEYKEGRHLLERCDKLLHSIAEMAAATDMQPSPVSVLDSSLYKDESSTPSPVTTRRRNIDFKDQYGETEDYKLWSPTISPVGSKSYDSDFVYVSDILRASHYLPSESNPFLLLEKQQYLKGKDTSKVSMLQRKLVFETINEILDRKRRMPPWKVVSLIDYQVTKPSLNNVWFEFERIRERDSTAEDQDLFETVCGVLKKDLAGDGINGWGDCPVEMSEAILDIERLIFKDLIGENIRDLAALASSRSTYSRRKLVF